MSDLEKQFADLKEQYVLNYSVLLISEKKMFFYLNSNPNPNYL